MISGTITTDGPIWMIPRMRTAEVIRLAPGTPATSTPSPARNACSAEMPMTPRATTRMVVPASRMNSSPRSDAIRRPNIRAASASRGHLRIEKPGDDDGDEELDRAGAGLRPDRKQGTAQRFELRSDPGERLLQIGRGELPELVDRSTDQRPALDRVGRRRQRQRRGIELLRQRQQAVDQADNEPRRRPDHDQQAQEREQNRRQSAPAAQPGGEPFVRRIERDGQHDAPDRDRDERADQDEGPIEQEGEDAEPDRQLDPGGREPIAARCSGIIGWHVRSPPGCLQSTLHPPAATAWFRNPRPRRASPPCLAVCRPSCTSNTHDAPFRPRPEEHPCKSIDLHGCVSKDEGGPALPAASCFETHRSATEFVETVETAARCDAPQHEAD